MLTIEQQVRTFKQAMDLALQHHAADRLPQAESIYRQILQADPSHTIALHLLGVIAHQVGKDDTAVDLITKALAIKPDYAEAHSNLGTSLQVLGKLEEAVASYRKALAIKPDFAEAHFNLGNMLSDLGKLEEAVASYRKALAIKPDFAEAHNNLGNALSDLGKLEEAVASYGKALVIKPDFAEAQVNNDQGKLVLLRQGDPEAAVAVCDAYLRDHPGDTRMLAFKAVALVETGEREAARALIDFDRFIRPTRVQAPDGFETVAAFNAALAQHVRAHPTLVYAPPTNATRLGRQTGILLQSHEPKPRIEAEGPVVLFEGMIRDAVEDYRRALPPDGSHPFLARTPERFGLSVWGVVLEGPGHQIPHIHSEAWLSGVYYAQLPDAVRTSGNRHAGWIEFGRPPQQLHCAAGPEVRLVRPEEGLMVLFPSYFYHRTVPTESAGMRISISFDVLAYE